MKSAFEKKNGSYEYKSFNCFFSWCSKQQILYTVAYVRVDEHTIGGPEEFCHDWINHVSH